MVDMCDDRKITNVLKVYRHYIETSIDWRLLLRQRGAVARPVWEYKYIKSVAARGVTLTPLRVCAEPETWIVNHV